MDSGTVATARVCAVSTTGLTDSSSLLANIQGIPDGTEPYLERGACQFGMAPAGFRRQRDN
ncbi:hypothetical protein I0E98_21815 [Pseudomonas lalucatii]|nr:hypothetical protein [Pseudomonas lalucatii]